MAEHKTFTLASFKAADDGTKGEFAALVSVFNVVDHGGDRVIKGAFAKSLERWRASGDPIPVIWNHEWSNPLAHIGKVDPAEAVETDEGLLVKGTLDIDDNQFAAQVYRLLSERRVKELSFGYTTIDSKQKDGANELRELDLIEVGPTLKGMNASTELLAVKSLTVAEQKASQAFAAPLADDDIAAVKRSIEILTAQADAGEKAGARLSKETRSAIAEAIDLLGSLIAVTDEVTDETKSIEAKASGTASDLDEELRMQIQLLKENH